MEIRDPDSLYQTFDIQQRYDDPTTYGEADSHFGKGRYPPDWEQRRDAIWWLQDQECARCGESPSSHHKNVHHIQHLQNGGRNDLENLAGLCTDCHALMHPDLDWMDGEYERASLFPAESARDEVAVVRWPEDGAQDGLQYDFERLAETSSPTVNGYAVTDAAVPTSPDDARAARTDLTGLLKARGHIARTSDYHELRVKPWFRGVRGLFTRFEPPVDVDSDGDLVETDDWQGWFSRRRDVRCSEDATNARVEIKGGSGETVSRSIALDSESTERDVEVSLSPPPLTPATAPRYAANGLWYFGYKSVVRGIIPALAVAFFAHEVVPFGGSIAGFATLVFLLGLALTVPTVLGQVYRTIQDDG